MSRGCYKAYGRKLAGPAPTPSIQFDSLFCDKNNSNKPTASKSTGTVGKWGITSFTSIRSSNFTVGLSGSCKRPRGESKIKSSPTIVEPPVAIPEEPVAQPPKPKKFFKSRNAPDSAAAPTSTPHHPAPASKPHKPYQSKSPKRPQSPPPPPASRQYVKASNRPVRQASIAASKKLVDLPDQDFEEEFDVYPKNMAVGLVEELPVESVHKIDHQLPSPPPEEESAHPPIVLRIFKGTAQLLTDGVVQDVPAKKEGRRRSHGSDSGDSISPKRHKSKHRDVDVDKVVEPEIKVKSERENLGDDEDREMREVEQCLQEANDLLAATENIDCKISRLEKPVDKKTLAELERVKLLRVLEDEEPSSPSPTPPAAPPLPAPPPPSDDLRSASSSFSPPPPPPQAVPAEGVIKQESGPAVVEHQSQPEDELLDDNRQWVADHYKPPPAVKLEDQGDVKVEPLVLRRPSAGGMTTKPPKKGSIFKSRGATGEKRNARYIHNWSDQKEEAKNKVKNEQPTANPYADDDFETESIDSLRRVVKYPAGEKDDDQGSVITSVTCSKEAKEYYTVVRNVKKVHQLQESGEFQEFNDDVEYILDALQDNNPISTRCLSAISLASKCMVPAFRMHVRAHGTVTKFFRALHDATKDQRLGMCTATVMFVLCQDRLNMDIDRDSLELMLNLLESDASHSSALEGCGLSDAELAKTKDRVRSLCQEIQEQGHAKHLNLDNITVGQLAMETLLSLTSRRAGEWFKEELRELGGLEHIIKTVVETCRPIDHSVTEWTPQLLERLKKADRCLKVLENVSLQNEENNNYLLTYGNGILVDTIVRIFHVCDRHIKYYPTTTTADKESMGAVIKECLIANLKVLINLTHDYGNKSFGSSMAGSKEGIIEASLHTLLEVPQYVPEEQKFDVTVLALILLINLVEHCEANRKLLIDAKTPVDPDSVFPDEVSAVKALINMFLKQEELARTEERKTDAILDGDQQPEEKEKEKEKAQKKTNEDAIEETVQLLLQKAGRHMEHTLVGAYIALLLGYLIIDNESYELFVRDQMPNKNYSMLLSVLQKFYNFMTLTAAAGSGSSRGIKATERLIKRLSEIDQAINNGQQSAS